MTEDIRKKLSQAREAALNNRKNQMDEKEADESLDDLVQAELRETYLDEQELDDLEIKQFFSAEEEKKQVEAEKNKSYMNKFILASLVMMLVFASLSLDIFSLSSKKETIKTDDYTYEGKVKRGSYDGPATLTFSNGSVLKGNFKSGKLVGKFEYTDADKNQVTGSVSSQISANVVLANGNKLDYSKGTFEETTNEFSYVGAWDTHGLVYKGNIKFANQAEYDGEFSLGVPNGQGQYKATDGQVLKGNFVNGVLTNGEE
ncbi:hypothetical protein OZX60_04360 [Streptococcaceae bacterium ESL0687]|nr:hypothetical protein OZX60_04360 [Streptococcaceae bacterium ESL0687]